MESEWLQKATEKVLKQIADTYAFKNPRLEFSVATRKGNNFVGQVYRCVLTEKDNSDKKLHLIIKLPPFNEKRRQAICVDELFRRESLMYGTILPALADVYKKKSLLQYDDVFPCTARTYALFHEEENMLIVMEDLKQRGFVMKNKRVGLDVDHCCFVLRHIARLHAASLALQKDNPELHENLIENFEELSFRLDDEISEFFVVGIKRFRDTIDERYPLGSALRRKAENFFENFQSNMNYFVKRNSTFCCITHGDLWANNILFKYKENSEIIEDVCFLDLQLSRMSSPVLDITYFVSLCTTKETRKSYKTFIRCYYDSLCSSLRDLGHDPEEIVPWTLLQEELKKYSSFGWAIATTCLPYLLVEEEDVEMMEKIFNAQHLKDYQLRVDVSDVVKDRFFGLLEDAEDLGVS